jgi:uncharacterized iron-regulated protein
MTRRDVVRAGIGAAVMGAFGVSAAAEAAVDTGRWRVYDARDGKDRRWRDLAGLVAGADAIFVGEFHDDSETHRAEAAILEAVHGRVKDRLALGLEMCERDGQAALDAYLAGKTAEDALPKAVVGWSNYKTDYRPLVEYARAKRLPVLATNAPQRIVRRVGKEGLAAVLPSLTDEEKGFVAAYVTAPEDDYFRRFSEVMGGGMGSAGGAHGGGMDAATLRRVYEAQCLRDDTMADTVARAVAAGRVVVHVNGAFHSDAGLGTAARTLWRRPLGTRIAVVKIVPVKGDVRAADPTKDRAEADVLVYVPDLRPSQQDKPAAGAK